LAEDLIHGIHPVIETLRAGRRRVHEVMLVRDRGGARLDELRRLAREARVTVRGVDARFMREQFPNREDQGVAARAAPYPYVDLDELLASVPRPALLVALDEITDTGNLGAIVRSAVAMGAHGVIIHKDRSASITPAAVRASAGMTEHLSIARVTNLARAMDRVRDRGIWIRGLDGDAAQTLYEEDLTADTLIVMGSEEKGMRRLTRERCDSVLRIPMDARCPSLNVSTAAAVALAEARRQRGRGP